MLSDFVKKVLDITEHRFLEKKDDFGWTPLHYAAYIGNQDVVEQFLKTNSSLAYTKNKEGMSILHIAAQRGCIGVIDTLIQKCPDVAELLDDKDQTALHVAVANRNMLVVTRFLGMMHFNDLLNEPNKDGNTCLHVAALKGYEEIVLCLLNDRRVDHVAINNSGMTALLLTLSSREKNITRCLDGGKLLAKTQETELEVPSQDGKPAGPSNTSITTAQVPSKDDEKSLLVGHIQNLSAINLLLATIIASITFSSIIQMPGGHNSDGMPILRNLKTFKTFLLFNSLAFGLSAASICLHFASPFIAMISGLKYIYPSRFSILLTCLSICFTLVAFVSARSAVLNEKGKFNFDDLVPFIFSFVVPLVYSLLIYVKTRVRAMYVLPYWLPSA
ncbi:hypothetical protein UlMin_007036 [Ulmus minor]